MKKSVIFLVMAVGINTMAHLGGPCSVSDSFFAQTEEGTPENVLANFNEVIKEHNKLLAKKTKK